MLLGIRPDIALNVGFLAVFYAMYYGVLARDIAEICANRLASKLGVRNTRYYYIIVHKLLL